MKRIVVVAIACLLLGYGFASAQRKYTAYGQGNESWEAWSLDCWGSGLCVFAHNVALKKRNAAQVLLNSVAETKAALDQRIANVRRSLNRRRQACPESQSTACGRRRPDDASGEHA